MLLDCDAGDDSWESLGLQGDQPILKEINPDYSLEGLRLKLKLQYFGHPMRRGDTLEKTLMLGKIEGRKRRGQQRMWWLDGIISLSKLWEIAKNREVWCAAVHGVTKSQIQRQGIIMIFILPMRKLRQRQVRIQPRTLIPKPPCVFLEIIVVTEKKHNVCLKYLSQIMILPLSSEQIELFCLPGHLNSV